MNCIVTAGPTYEALDHVRRLTNLSTGRLGVELANFLTARRNTVTLLVGEQATYCGERRAQHIQNFTTSSDLHDRLQGLASQPVQAVFHAAAVGDFQFGRIWFRSAQGELTPVKAGKINSRQGPLLAELVPTRKIIASLRDWFPQARIAGWKYEVDGGAEQAFAAAEKQIRECLTDVCVANGPAYGEGFGLVRSNRKTVHCSDVAALFEALAKVCGC